MEAELLTLFFTAVGSFAASESLLVVYPDVDPPDGISTSKHYLRCYTFKPDPNGHGIKGESKHTWVLQVSIRSRAGSGQISPSHIVDKLAAAFPVGRNFVGATQVYTVETPPSPAPRIPLDAWSSIPVSFRIQTVQ